MKEPNPAMKKLSFLDEHAGKIVPIGFIIFLLCGLHLCGDAWEAWRNQPHPECLDNVYPCMLKRY